MAPPAKRPKYQAKDLVTKVEILKALKNGVSRHDVMEKYGVKRTTLAMYVKNESNIMETVRPTWQKKTAADGSSSGTRKYRTEMDQKCTWIANLPVSGPLICAQPERFAAKMNIEEFKASAGWLARFKSRHNLAFKSVCGEKAAMDEGMVEEWWNVRLPEHLAKYDARNVFNANETALFFKALP